MLPPPFLKTLWPCLALLALCGCSSPATPMLAATQLPPTLAPDATPTSQPVAATATPSLAALGPLTLTSPNFQDGQEMADKYVYQMGGQCQGENYSPALEWTGVPSGTQSFAITVIDPDGGNWVHWLQFNLPATTTRLPEALGGPEIGLKGKNDFWTLGYGGPCPPSGTHRYVFTLYALKTTLDFPEGARLDDLQAALDSQTLAKAQLTGLRTK